MHLYWGIIGCGDVAERKGGPALYTVKNSHLIAVMRRNEEKAKDFARRHGAKRYYIRIEDLLSDPDINAVYVATPPYLHAPQTIQAADAGKHVLCEKPMAMNETEALQMITACRRNNVQLMIAYYRRRFGSVVKMGEIIDSGKIGRPVKARLEIDHIYKPPRSEKELWRFDPKIGGGGLLMDIGSHGIDILHLWLGNVSKVAAFLDTVAHDTAVETSSSVILQFNNDVQGTVCINQNSGINRNILEVTGTEGKVSLTGGLAAKGIELETKEGKQSFDLPLSSITHQGIVENYIHSIGEGKINCSPGEEGLKTTRVLDACYASSAQGRIIHLASR